jgi:TldD protein
MPSPRGDIPPQASRPAMDQPARPVRHFGRPACASIVADAVEGADDGELYLESSESEALMFDNGRLKTANYSAPTRASACARSPARPPATPIPANCRKQALLRAADAVSAVRRPAIPAQLAAAPARTNRHLYGDENPIGEVAVLRGQGQAAAGNRRLCCARKDPRVRQVTASLASSWQHVEIWCAATARWCATSARWCG